MLKQARSMIHDAEKYLHPLAIGGTAVGTGLNSPKDFGEKVAKAISEETGMPFTSAPNKFYALTGRDNIVFAHGALDALAGDCMKFADDIRLLAGGPRAGLGEISIPANEPGSSIMPGKVNPTQCEALTMVACRVHGNQTVVSMASSQGRFELNVFAPILAESFIESTRLLGDAIHSFDIHCAQGIKVNEERMEELVEKSLMLVTALSPHIGYEKSAQIAKKAFADNSSLKEAAVALGFVTAEDYDKWVNPREMTNVDR
jgi:fumarate hydratase, class II